MTIKSDRWIREMAVQGMIEPFEPEQVRYAGDQKVISYGTSSYGYDVRCAPEFKVFTNIYSATVDPKSFDSRSFVDVSGDVCVIPPNSFALASTVEYFRIPRDVLVICLGKSTYARCFRGDQRVALVDGTSVSLEDMARRADQGEDFWGYSMGPLGLIEVTKLEAPRWIGRDALLEIELDSGEVVRCTPDHVVHRRDGTAAPAADLRPRDSLMPLYRETFRGYEMVYQPINGHYWPTQRLADEWNIRHGIYANDDDQHRQIARRNLLHQEITATVRATLDAKESIRDRLQNGIAGGNHQIEAIRELPGDHDVYCLTVPEAGNFALEAGVFVANCGIIVNVTPLEPEWEGHVTLEFSNTTNLPAKIYANEGVAQMLFFQSDEPCEVTYKDRGGKYQGQRGVTLPKT
jgi:deoxycytidine triphosphate deaminase